MAQATDVYHEEREQLYLSAEEKKALAQSQRSFSVLTVDPQESKFGEVWEMDLRFDDDQSTRRLTMTRTPAKEQRMVAYMTWLEDHPDDCLEGLVYVRGLARNGNEWQDIVPVSEA